MADTIIKSFLVQLGFKIDEASLRKFEAQVKETEKSVKSFAIGMAALAVGVEEAIRRVGREFQQLFFLSAQIGTSVHNLESMQFALSQIGITAGQFGSALSSINTKMLESPGMRYYIHNLLPSFSAVTGTAEQALEGMADRLEALMGMEEGAAKNSAIAVEIAHQRRLGLDTTMMLQMAKFGKERRYWQEEDRKFLEAIHLSADESAKQSFMAMQAWGFAWRQVTNIFNLFTLQTMPMVQGVLTRFSKWLSGPEGTALIKEWGDWLRDYFSDPKRIQEWGDKLVEVGRGAVEVAKAFVVLAGWIIKLNDALGSTKTLLAVLIGFAFLKGAIAGIGKGLAASLFGPLTAGAPAAGQQVGSALRSGISSRLTGFNILGMIAAIATSTPEDFIPGSKKNKEKSAAITRDADEATGGWFSTIFGAPGRLHERLFGDANRPDSYDGPPTGAMGGHDPLLEQMVAGLQHWWSGSGNFRPFVVLTDSYYTQIADVLRDVFDLHKLPDKGAGTGGTGTGAPGGPGGAGPHGMPGPGTGGGGAGAGGGGARLNLGQLKQLALDAGFTPEQAPIIAATLMHESQGDPNARNKTSGAAGIAQVNPAAWGADLANQSMGNAVRSMQIARMIFLKQGMRAWESYTKGYYKQYLDAANAAKPEAYNPTAGGVGAGGGGVMDPMAPAGTRAGAGGIRMTTITSSSGRKFTVAAEFAENFKGFINEYEKRGGVIGPSSGGLSERPGNASYHPLGRAIDVNQVGYGVRGGGSPLPEVEENELAKSWGLYPGALFKNRSDRGHFEVRNAIAAREALRRRQGGAEAKPPAPAPAAEEGFWGKLWKQVNPVGTAAAAEQVGRYAQAFGSPGAGASLTRGIGQSGIPRASTSTRHVDVRGDHTVTINVHGAASPTKTAEAVADIAHRHRMVHARNLRSAIA